MYKHSTRYREQSATAFSVYHRLFVPPPSAQWQFPKIEGRKLRQNCGSSVPPPLPVPLHQEVQLLGMLPSRREGCKASSQQVLTDLHFCCGYAVCRAYCIAYCSAVGVLCLFLSVYLKKKKREMLDCCFTNGPCIFFTEIGFHSSSRWWENSHSVVCRKLD